MLPPTDGELSRASAREAAQDCKAALRRLREKEAMLNAAQQLARLGSWTLHVASGEFHWSAEAYRIFGFAPGELERLTLPMLLEYVHAEDRGALEKLVTEAVSRKMTASYGYRFVCPDGKIKFIRGHGESQLDESGRVEKLVGTLMDATGEEQLHPDAQRRTDRFREVQESPDVWSWEQNDQFQFTFLSKGELKALGRLALGQTRWAAGFRPVAGTWDDHRSCLEQHRAFSNFEFYVDTGNGTRVVSTTGAPVFEPDGRFVGYRGTAHDVTELKEAQARISEQQSLLKIAADLGRVAGWMLHTDSRQLVASREFAAMLGFGHLPSLQEALSLLSAQARPRLERALEDCCRGGVVMDLEVDVTTARGEPISLRVVAEPAASDGGSPGKLRGAIQDVTERNRTRRALVESEERYRLLFEATTEAILEVHESGAICRANAAACALFGRRDQEMLVSTWRDLAPDGDASLRTLVRAHVSHGFARGRVVLARADGSTFEAEMSSMSYRTSDGASWVSIIVRDITRQLAFERELVRMNEELALRVRERTRELEASNEELRGFANAMAHDLRAPIAAVSAYAGALQALLPGDAGKQQHYCGRIIDAAQRADQQMQALLALAKLSQVELAMTEVDLSALAEAVLGELRLREPERNLHWEVQEGLRATGDAALLRLMLENLLGNAWKFTSGRRDARIAFRAAHNEQGELVFRVTDNGAGFDMKWAGSLFGNFQRLHLQSEFPGTGLGLASVKRIVGKHGGRIWADAAPERGAAFSFTLRPAATSAGSGPGPGPGPGAAGTACGR